MQTNKELQKTRETYPCTGYDCYERGNFHAGCSKCPYFKNHPDNRTNQPIKENTDENH